MILMTVQIWTEKGNFQLESFLDIQIQSLLIIKKNTCVSYCFAGKTNELRDTKNLKQIYIKQNFSRF